MTFVTSPSGVLDHLELDGDNYAEMVETATILSAEKVRRVVEPLRALIREAPEPDRLPSDLNSVVRRAIGSLREEDFWKE